MPEYRTYTRKIERRTYFKGRFTGKFKGILDADKSVRKSLENFYDLELLEALVKADKKDFQPWPQGGESEEFAELEKFLTRLAPDLPCEIAGENGAVRHFRLDIREPKLADISLTRRLYETDTVFVTVDAAISGYLVHFDEEEIREEISRAVISPPPQNPAPRIPAAIDPLTASAKKYIGARNRPAGCLALLNQKTAADGCLPALVIGFLALLFLSAAASVAWALISAIAGWLAANAWQIFRPAHSFALFKSADIFYLAAAVAVILLLLRLQSQLPPFWKRAVQIVIALVIILSWLGS